MSQYDAVLTHSAATTTETAGAKQTPPTDATTGEIPANLAPTKVHSVTNGGTMENGVPGAVPSLPTAVTSGTGDGGGGRGGGGAGGGGTGAATFTGAHGRNDLEMIH